MNGNLYGVDIKSTSDNKPYIIEVNGQRSGTSGFVLAYRDLRTQRDIMSALERYAGDKPIYRKSEIHDPDTSFSLKRAFLIALSKGAIALNQLWEGSL